MLRSLKATLRLRNKNVQLESLEERIVLTGNLDLGFGSSGNGFAVSSVVNPPATDTASPGLAFDVDSAGGIWVAGTSAGSNAFEVQRFTSDGVADGVFSIVTSRVDSADLEVVGLIVDDNDNVFLIGQLQTATISNQTLIVAKLTPDGSLDSNYGESGFFQLDDFGLTTDYVYDVDRSGRLLIGQRFTSELIRIEANGVLDSSFDGGSIDVGVLLNVAAGPNDGVIVSSTDDSLLINDVLISKYTPAGTLDSGFGTGGVFAYNTQFAVTYPVEFELTKSISVSDSGEVFVSGQAVATQVLSPLPDQVDAASNYILKLDANGSPASNFGTSGVVTTFSFEEDPSTNDDVIEAEASLGLQSNPRQVVVKDDGSILYTDLRDIEAITTLTKYQDVVVTKLASDGSVDGTFGSAGEFEVAYQNSPATRLDQQFYEIALQPNGDIVGAKFDSSYQIQLFRITDSEPVIGGPEVVDGVLIVPTTDGDDVVTVDVIGGNIEVTTNGQTTIFPVGIVDSIAISGGDGNDNIQLTNRVTVPARLDGGDGDDVIRGGGANDTILGGSGDDDLRGRRGDDIIIGGEGNDTQRGGRGDDFLIGGIGVDSVLGGNGRDFLSGDSSIYEDDEEALALLQEEWTSSRPQFLSRVFMLFGFGPVLDGSGVSVLDGFQDDGENDSVNGGAGFDWVV